MILSHHLNVGKTGEKLAKRFLKKQGYKILTTNFQNRQGRRLGEIDIIASLNKQLVFVEVKTRFLKNKSLILPEENIDKFKIQRLEKIIHHYLRTIHQENRPWRLDAISIWLSYHKEAFHPSRVFPEQNIHYLKYRPLFQKNIHAWIKHLLSIF